MKSENNKFIREHDSGHSDDRHFMRENIQKTGPWRPSMVATEADPRRITCHSRRTAFAALTPPPTDTLGSAAACVSGWSLSAIGRRDKGESK